MGGLGQIVLPTGVILGPNQSVPFPVHLVTGAPMGGVTVALASSDPSKVTITPSSVFIPFKSTEPATQPMVNGINFGSATISASAPGFIGDSQVVQVGGGISFSPPSVTILAGNTGNLMLILTGGQAPAGGLIINLSSSDPSKATVPATVSFVAGTNSVAVPVTAIAQCVVTIPARAPGLTPTTATVNVRSFGPTILPVVVQVSQGQPLSFPIRLSPNRPSSASTMPGYPMLRMIRASIRKVGRFATSFRSCVTAVGLGPGVDLLLTLDQTAVSYLVIPAQAGTQAPNLDFSNMGSASGLRI